MNLRLLQILLLLFSTALFSKTYGANNYIESSEMKHRNIGNLLALYPKLMTVVGAEVEGKINWLVVSHTGVIGHDRILVSREMLPQADYVGGVSGMDVDKSTVFEYHIGKNGSPIIDASPLAMECKVEDLYKTEGFDNFICSVVNTYALPEILTGDNRPDYLLFKPVLFDFPTYSYIATGEIIGKCLNLDKAPSICAKEPMADDGIVRLSKIEVYPQYLDDYMKYASEVGEISLRTEPGVLTMYAVKEIENPCMVTILETYASHEAYERHIASEHFQKYKKGTLHMVKSLILSDQTPLNPANILNNYIK